MGLLESAPEFAEEEARRVLAEHYGIVGRLRSLPSERDQNFRVDRSATERFVLKIANATDDPALLDAQSRMLEHLEDRVDLCPRLVPTAKGENVVRISGKGDRSHLVRLVTYIDGEPLGTVESRPPGLLTDLGRSLGRLDRALADFDHPALHRIFYWDLARGLKVIRQYLALVDDPGTRDLVRHLTGDFERVTVPRLGSLRTGVIHNDPNDHNVIVRETGDGPRVAGLIDLGDAVHSYTVGELAIGIAYAILDQPDPLDVAAIVARGYHEENPLTPDEIASLYGLVCLRLCASVCIAAYQTRRRPDDPYLAISQRSIRRTLPKLAARPFALGEAVFRDACGLISSTERPAAEPSRGRKTDEVLSGRRRRLGPNLSVQYETPVHVTRGWMQYLYDTDGHRFLDAYNNVPHVGHSHPRVVAAAARQMARLNTNTRYLYDILDAYAERLAATLPDPLEVCYFVNSATEANELALRMARVFTGGREMIVLGAAYHGHSTTLIDLSPYKHDGPGGEGAPSWVHPVPLPDLYRGPYRENDAAASEKYATHVADRVSALRSEGRSPAGFLAETCPSVGGQIFLPEAYLAAVYGCVRDAGGLCIADEVQTAYGRLGSCFYAFEEHGVVPDVVVLGKPIGNGHPIGAVVTTRAVADAFDNGMEFFSTFGGNTVSCEIGRTVLAVVQEEGLQEHARVVGGVLLDGLRELQDVHDAIGDVRGSGLFIGVELVRDRGTREPATRKARAVANRMRDAGVLIGTDGPDDNVLKIRPPMPFDENDAGTLLRALDDAMHGRSQIVG
jgi:4-aminobutyrate aminotransferase-like enzyme/Ser/Thr protein kinase RdoA (MazF antagonist)